MLFWLGILVVILTFVGIVKKYDAKTCLTRYVYGGGQSVDSCQYVYEAADK